MKIFTSLFNDKCKREHLMNKQSFGKLNIYAHRGDRQIEAITNSPKSLEGNRSTFVVRNEALALDTPIPSPSGWTTMGALRDGDIIFGDDGHPCTVVKAHPIQEGRRCFEVTFADGTSVVASDGHWWQTSLVSSAALPRRRTTLEMFEDGRKFAVPRAGVRVTKPVDLPVDPYLLGVWLGDGSTGACNITVGDFDLLDLESQLAVRGVPTHRLKRDEAKAQRISFSTKTGFGGDMGSPVGKVMRSLPCYRDKHVPDQFLHAGTEQRLELLRGLMDTDGCLTQGGRAIFVGTERLARDVLELVRSLGQVATLCFAADGRSRHGGSWRVAFTPKGIQPFALPRKAERVASAARDWVSIKQIREVDSVPVRCLTVDSPTHLFQAGLGGHVTSNTQHWDSSNGGIEMADVIERNATKAKGGAARSLSITNAYEPTGQSVGQSQRESWEAEHEGLAISTGVLYDSLEVPRQYGLTPPGYKEWPVPANPAEQKAQEDSIKAYLATLVRCARGDAWWLDVPGIVNSILDRRNPPSRSRRFWLNQVHASEDAWADPAAVDAAEDMLAAAERRALASGNASDILRAGWVVGPDEPVVVFGDGSKSDDATGLVGCRLSDGYCFTIGVWARPANMTTRDDWLVSRADVDVRVAEMFERFNVVGFWFDPSHSLDDDNSRYWDGYLDDWHRRYGEKLQTWAVKTGDNRHSIMWDMTSSERQKMFVAGVETAHTELHHKKNPDGPDFHPKFTHDGHPALKQHLKNAVRYPITLPGPMTGVSIAKEHRSSAKKIDLAACLVGARMLRRIVLNIGLEDKTDEVPSTGWGMAL